MNQPNHHQIATYLTDYVLSELVKYVIEDTGCTTEQAMEQVYNSPLMTLLQDEEGEQDETNTDHADETDRKMNPNNPWSRQKENIYIIHLINNIIKT